VLNDETMNPTKGGWVISDKQSPPVERLITRRAGNDVWYMVKQGDGMSPERNCLLVTWRRWCRANAARNVK